MHPARKSKQPPAPTSRHAPSEWPALAPASHAAPPSKTPLAAISAPRPPFQRRAPSFRPLGYVPPSHDVLEKIAVSLKIPTYHEITSTGFRNYVPSDWWLVALTGDYATVIHNKANPHLETNTFPDGRRGMAFSPEVHFVLCNLTGTVVHVPTMSVVRRSVPPAPIIGANSLREVSYGDFAYTSQNVAVPSLASLVRNADDVTFHPRYEGPIVYVWKHNGIVRFSTRRKLDAKNSRWGGSRQFSEIWAALDGPPIASFFPDDSEPDGEGVSHAFVLAHPSLITVSRIDVGHGYLVYLGAICAHTGNFLRASNPRVKWGSSPDVNDVRRLPPAPRIEAHVHSEECEYHCDFGEDFEERNLMEYWKTHEFLNRAVAYQPFPAPSVSMFRFPEKGDANRCAEDALSGALQSEGVWTLGEESVGEADPPLTYAVPTLTMKEAESHLLYGFNQKSCPIAEPLDAAEGKAGEAETSARIWLYKTPDGREYLYVPDVPVSSEPSVGEPVVVRAVFNRDTDREYVLCFTIQPEYYTWCVAVFGNAETTAQRVMTLEKMASMHRRRLESTTESCHELTRFDRTPFVTGLAVQTLLQESIMNSRDCQTPYNYLFENPPAYAISLGSEACIAVLERFRAAIAAKQTSMEMALPNDLIGAMLEAKEKCEAAGDIPENAKQQLFASQDPYFLWAMLRLTTALAPHRQPEALKLMIDYARAETPFCRAVEKVREFTSKAPENQDLLQAIINRAEAMARAISPRKPQIISRDAVLEIINAAEDRQSKFLPAPEAQATTRVAEIVQRAL